MHTGCDADIVATCMFHAYDNHYGDDDDGALLGLFWGVLGPLWSSLGRSGRSLGAIFKAMDPKKGWY